MPPADLLAHTATAYGVCGALAALLQARQVLRRGSSCDVSARFFATYAGGYAIWLLYGISIGSVPLILVDAAGVVCGGTTLAVTLRLRGSLVRPRTWSRCPNGASLRPAGSAAARARTPAPTRRRSRRAARPPAARS